jgi:hypothetical protein
MSITVLSAERFIIAEGNVAFPSKKEGFVEFVVKKVCFFGGCDIDNADPFGRVIPTAGNIDPENLNVFG